MIVDVEKRLRTLEREAEELTARVAKLEQLVDRPIAYTLTEGGEWIPGPVFHSDHEGVQPAAEMYADGRVYDHVLAAWREQEPIELGQRRAPAPAPGGQGRKKKAKRVR